jgi:hypothetical protein
MKRPCARSQRGAANDVILNPMNARRTFTIAIIAVFCVSLSAYAGAPLKGVDVKLGKNPGGQAAKRTTSDGSGKADLGVVPAGSYLVSFEMRGESSDADVEITGAVGGAVRKRWSFKENKAFERDAPSTARSGGQPHIVIETDGEKPVQVTIVKSKSNISNN